MVAVRYTTLPHVLNEYLPEQQAPNVSEEDDEEEVDHYEDRKSKGKSSKGRHKSAPRAPSRERTQERLKIQQSKERYERQYETWQEVKAIYRDEQTREFRKKSSLQKQLITSRDNLRQIRQREQEEDRKRLREADRAAKQAQTSYLEQICRESLDEDKRNALEHRRTLQKTKHGAARNRSNNAGSITDDSSASGGASGGTYFTNKTAPQVEPRRKGVTVAPRMERRGSDDLYPQEKGVFVPSRHRSDLSTHSSLASGPLHHITGGPTPGTPLYEEDDDDVGTVTSGSRGNTGDSTTTTSDALPWHHQQLYRLYGKSAADEFLFPKFEDKKRTIAPKAINPKLRRRGVNAGELWDELRNDSRMKLLKEDSTIAPELKYAYSAFVRQLLQRRKKPVKRNYYDKEDVPDLDLLMDQSRIREAQDYRHKCEIMYRSSHMNEDKSRVLIYNNPPPDLNNWTGQESCERYMPSWTDIQSDASSELSYKKWINRSQPAGLQEYAGEGTGQQVQETLQLPAVEHGAAGKQNDADTDFLVAPHRSRKHNIPHKIAFLTEKEAQCEGQFTARHRQAEEMKNVPTAYSEVPNVVAQSAMAMIGDNSSRRESAMSGSYGGRKSSLRRAQSEMQGTRYTSAWQPLSLGALVEYKHNVPALGHGDFALGKTSMWKTETSPA